jgi:hypothetical protein
MKESFRMSLYSRLISCNFYEHSFLTNKTEYCLQLWGKSSTLLNYLETYIFSYSTVSIGKCFYHKGDVRDCNLTHAANRTTHTERWLYLPNKGMKGSGMQAFTIIPSHPRANCHSGRTVAGGGGIPSSCSSVVLQNTD